jgi:hypothetical protein
MTKLTGALPAGDGNGLDSIARDLIERPHDLRVVIALVDCRRTTTDNDTGEVEPTARIRRVEVVDGEDLAMAERIMRRALEKRTGSTVLPIDLEDAITDAFRNVDPATGEVTGPSGDSGGQPE